MNARTGKKTASALNSSEKAVASRRRFLGQSLALAGAAAMAEGLARPAPPPQAAGPLAVATWGIGRPAAEEAARLLSQGVSGADAVERAVNSVESDPLVDSVGLGGLPNRKGEVELDAAIIDGPGETMGSVAGLKDVARAISVARRVGEKTPHIMLCGDSATRFALENGFERVDLLTDKSRKKWQEYKQGKRTRGHSHDTVSLIVRDAGGDLFAGCSSSGLAWKLPGRVGDAALIGSGIALDNSLGAAVSTGIGELCIRHSAAFAALELMRQGARPQAACEAVIERIIAGKEQESRRWQVGLIAVARSGDYGAAAIQRGFQVASYDFEESRARLAESPAVRR